MALHMCEYEHDTSVHEHVTICLKQRHATLIRLLGWLHVTLTCLFRSTNSCCTEKKLHICHYYDINQCQAPNIVNNNTDQRNHMSDYNYVQSSFLTDSWSIKAIQGQRILFASIWHNSTRLNAHKHMHTNVGPQYSASVSDKCSKLVLSVEGNKSLVWH